MYCGASLELWTNDVSNGEGSRDDGVDRNPANVTIADRLVCPTTFAVMCEKKGTKAAVALWRKRSPPSWDAEEKDIRADPRAATSDKRGSMWCDSLASARSTVPQHLIKATAPLGIFNGALRSGEKPKFLIGVADSHLTLEIPSICPAAPPARSTVWAKQASQRVVWEHVVRTGSPGVAGSWWQRIGWINSWSSRASEKNEKPQVGDAPSLRDARLQYHCRRLGGERSVLHWEGIQAVVLGTTERRPFVRFTAAGRDRKNALYDVRAGGVSRAQCGKSSAHNRVTKYTREHSQGTRSAVGNLAKAKARSDAAALLLPGKRGADWNVRGGGAYT
ncbi:hypothetical protein FB451DRAFT_1168332 [Mycena latifolia]|nr:hypothetical protein FB451DRAFT_1168332 [Mycena latifolia]